MSRCIHQVYQEHREFPGIYIQYVSLKTVITGPDKTSSGSEISRLGIQALEPFSPRIECRTRKILKY